MEICASFRDIFLEREVMIMFTVQQNSATGKIISSDHIS